MSKSEKAHYPAILGTSDSLTPATSAEDSAYRTILMRKLSRIGVRTLSVNNHGLFFIHLKNRKSDVEYQIPATRVPAWIKQMEGDRDANV